MAEIKVYFVTHGDRYYGPKHPDPGMTRDGHKQIRALKHHLPSQEIGEVVVGSGKRFFQMARDLGLQPTRVTTVIGTADAIDEDGEYIVLPSKILVPRKMYTTRVDQGNALELLIRKLPLNSIILGGRPSISQLGHKNAKTGSLYLIIGDGNGELAITELASLGEGTYTA